jgi:hypothetical protein
MELYTAGTGNGDRTMQPAGADDAVGPLAVA